MAGFQTEGVIPDQQDSVTGFFRVVSPLLLLFGTTAWIRTYYVMNMKELPWFFDWPLIILCILATFICFYKWYHQAYEKRGRLAINEKTIDFEWNTDDVNKTYHFNVEDLKDITFLYDGYAGAPGGAKGTENELRFQHEDTDYKLNFRLGSQDDAEEMGAIIKKWYEKGLTIKEFGADGEGRYLLMYPPKYKEALPTAAAQEA